MGQFHRLMCKLLILTCVLAPILAQAEFTVIYDSGQTQAIGPLLEGFDSQEPPPALNRMPAEPPLGAADPKNWLPIRSPGLTPGSVNTQKTRPPGRTFARPFFLIGSDARSRHWLQQHAERLKALGAVGMLVQAESLEDLHAVAELAQGLSILPASGSDVAQALGISHYPVLITAHGIEQ